MNKAHATRRRHARGRLRHGGEAEVVNVLLAPRRLARNETVRAAPPRHRPPTFPRAGFDRFAFHGPTVFSLSYRLNSEADFPAALCGYDREGDYWAPEESGYVRFIRYRHRDDANAPRLAIFYRPRNFPRPAFRVEVRAVMVRLLDLKAVAAIVEELLQRCHVSFTLAVVELTIDFPASRVTMPALHEKLYRPRTPYAVASRAEWDWCEAGSRKASHRVRVYTKPEDGVMATRVELTLRRDDLRRLGINTIPDVCRASWTDIAWRRFRFVEFHPSRRNTGRMQWLYQLEMEARGVNDMLNRLTPKNRRWLRNRLQPATVQEEVNAVLGRLERRLRKILGDDAPRTHCEDDHRAHGPDGQTVMTLVRRDLVVGME